MSENDQPKQFLPDDELDNERIVVEVPADAPQDQERIPSGYDPMGSVYLRGRAFRGLAGGRISWWILISGWIMFGGSALFILILAITSAAFWALPVLVIASIPLVILWRGTSAKISIAKRRNRGR